MNKDTYTPNKQNAAILARGFELVQSVPYQVSSRWVFYGLLQEGFYSKKSDYKNKWLKAVSSARHAFYGGWRPNTLADETRDMVIRSSGHRDSSAWLNALAARIVCNLDKVAGQENYVMLWFEARAMLDQFRHYTQHIDLVPMGGQPSIPYKWDIAKRIEHAKAYYGLPIVVLYFGDLDQGGDNIANTAETDVRKWCDTDFGFIRCGLTLDQVQRYNVPENPEKPGEYQWEALDDTSAQAIITAACKPYLRHDAFSAVVQHEQTETEKLRVSYAT